MLSLGNHLMAEESCLLEQWTHTTRSLVFRSGQSHGNLSRVSRNGNGPRIGFRWYSRAFFCELSDRGPRWKLERINLLGKFTVRCGQRKSIGILTMELSIGNLSEMLSIGLPSDRLSENYRGQVPSVTCQKLLRWKFLMQI